MGIAIRGMNGDATVPRGEPALRAHFKPKDASQLSAQFPRRGDLVVSLNQATYVLDLVICAPTPSSTNSQAAFQTDTSTQSHRATRGEVTQAPFLQRGNAQEKRRKSCIEAIVSSVHRRQNGTQSLPRQGAGGSANGHEGHPHSL